MKTAADPCTLPSTSKTRLALSRYSSLTLSSHLFFSKILVLLWFFRFPPLSILPHYSLPMFPHFPANSFNMGLDLASLSRNTRFFIAIALFFVEPSSSILLFVPAACSYFFYSIAFTCRSRWCVWPEMNFLEFPQAQPPVAGCAFVIQTRPWGLSPL